MSLTSDFNTKLSSSITVGDYRKLLEQNDKKAISAFICERFDERYFNPILNSSNKHGFSMLAIGCLVLETLESFYQGKGDTKNASKKMFKDFFARNTEFKVFESADDWFYQKIRCGILHQAETLDGWRILRSGLLLNRKDKTINAETFIKQLQKELKSYSELIYKDEQVWKNFKLKMDAICKSCVHSVHQ